MKEKDLTPEEGLALINNMIGKARKRYTDNSFFFLLWGWLVMVASAANYILLEYTDVENPSIVWLLMVVGGIVSGIYGSKKRRNATVAHYTDKLYMWLWMGLGAAMVIVIISGDKTNFMITPLMLMLSGVGTFVSGAMMKFRLLQLGGFILWAGSLLAFQLAFGEQLLVMAAAIALGYLLPGYVMKAKYKKNGI